MYAVDYVYEDGAASTIKTTSTWTPEVVPSTTLTVDYDVWVEGGKLCWKVTSSHGASSYGEIGDADVLAMMDKNWVYPVAFSAGGDGNGSTLNEIAIWADVRDFDAATEYEKKAYSKKEIYDLYTDALYGREEDAQALLELDLSDVTGNAAEATFTVENTKIGINGSMTGVHQEYYDCYSYFYDENGNLRDDYKIWAHGQEPISSVRFGGASSLKSNMWADLNKKPTYYVSLPSDMLADAEQESKLDEAERTKPYIGKKIRDAYKMGLAEQIAAFKENNPKMSFTLCVSPFTTTADDLRNLVTALTKTGVEVNGQTVESLRQEWFGSTAPINIYAIELGNEVEWQIETNEDFEARAAWYQDYAMKMMDVMDEVDPSGKIKVMICGTTAPWGNDGTNGVITNRWKRWLTHLMTDLELSGDGTYVPAATGGQSLVERADIVTYHPYYYGHISEYLIKFADLWYNGDEDFAGLKSENPNIKLSYSEHGVNWEVRRLDTTNLYSALSNSYFIQIASECPYSDSAYQHSMVGNDLWSRWQYQDGQFVENPLGTTFNLMTDTYGNNVYNSTFEITTDQEDAYFADSDAATTTSTRFIATAFEVSDDTINLVFTNNQGYTPVNTTINLPQELADYKLVKTAVMTAPNMYSHTFNLATDKIAKINTVELDTPEAVPATYTVPAKSIVVLTISTNTSKKLKDEFNYAAGNPVSSNVDSETFETTPNTIVTASNGTKWITASSWAQAAYGDEGDMGTAQLDGSRLVVNNRSDSPYPMIANWDISEYSAIDELESMTSITFKTTNTNANGGVKLFVTPVYDADSATYIHTSNYYFSNELAGMDGTIDWTVILDKANGKLYWTADGIDSNNGVMSITSDDLTDYTYFAQLFVEDNYGTSGSVALDEISVIYGGTETPDMPKQFITIGEAAENKIPVTVEPSVKPAGVTTFTVIAAYYTGTKLDKVVTTDFTADATAQDTINLDTAASGQTIKLMVWDSASGMKPINGSALSVQ